MTSHPQDDSGIAPIQAAMAAPVHSAGDSQSTQRGKRAPAMLQSKLAVLAVLFCVTGFLGLPLLWVNKRFSNVERIFWTAIVSIYTCTLLAGTAAVIMWAYRQVAGG